MGSQTEAIRRLRSLLSEAPGIGVLTGAGISAESGIPTFRDAQTGYWSRFSPQDLATPEAFRRDPRTVWRWYAERRAAALAVQPNAGHFALARLEAETVDRGARFSLVTQNVDGLHTRAGSQQVTELHGNIMRVRCFSDCVSYSFGEDAAEAHAVFAGDAEAHTRPPEVPRCPQCGGYLRPDVVWFGENLDETAIARAFTFAETAALFLVIGTSSVVYPAAMLPESALQAGAAVVEINPDATPLSEAATLSIRGKAGEVLPLVVQR